MTNENTPDGAASELSAGLGGRDKCKPRKGKLWEAIAAAHEDGHVNLGELYSRGVIDGLKKAAMACEYEAVMYDIVGAHATATHLAKVIRKMAAGGLWPDTPKGVGKLPLPSNVDVNP